MAKVNVKVCLGTTCFVMGSSNLQELLDLVQKKYGEDVISKAPYVKVNDEIIKEATVEKVIAAIDRELK